MKQAKKIFTKILLNNWGGIEHHVIELNEYVNLFCGKSGSGKSTVMDAIQVVLYGSLAAAFLNKAADDAKNRRTVLSYLRGEQKDGTANRENRDFCAQIVLEIEDTGNHIVNCVGVTFEVGRNDQDIKNHYFFSHSGRMPEDGYLTEKNVPYSISQMRDLIKERQQSRDNRGRGDINRMYPSKEAYLNTLNDVILGYIDGARFVTMEKSSIALKMTNGTGQFIRDYMFPQSKADTIEKISEQLGAYSEIKDKIEDLEKRITMLTEVYDENRYLYEAETGIVKTEAILRYVDIENQKNKLEARQQDLESLCKKMEETQTQKDKVEAEQTGKTNELIEVEAALKASDCGQKEKELEEMENTIELLRSNSESWRSILRGLQSWVEDEIVTDYVSNPMRNLIKRFQTEPVTESDCLQMKKRIAETVEYIDDELEERRINKTEVARELDEKKTIVEDLRNDRKSYEKKLTQAKSKLEQELTSRYGRRIPVYIFADLFDVKDEVWKNAIEGRMGRLKKSLITAPEHAHDAAVIFRKMKQFEEVDLINSAAIQRDQPRAEENSLYEAVQTTEKFVDICLKRYLGRIIKCQSVEDLEQVRDGVTPDCYSYSNYIFRHLRERDYNLGACIGTTVSKAKLRQLEDEVTKLSAQLHDMTMEYTALKNSESFERLRQGPPQLIKLSQASQQLEEYFKKKEKLQKEIDKLKNGSLVKALELQQIALKAKLEVLGNENKKLGNNLLEINGKKGQIESDIKNGQEKLDTLMMGFVFNESIEMEVKEELRKVTESTYRTRQMKKLEQLDEERQMRLESRGKARMRFNREYPSLGFSGEEKDNQVYDSLLEHYRKDFEPKFKEDFQRQCEQVYKSLRENVIASIHGEIKAAYRHTRDINRMLAKIRFSDSIYQIEILPANNENGQFYEMLMAKELDTKNLDTAGFDGQMSFGEDDFYQKYEQKIQLLTEKFMPPKDGDKQKQLSRTQEMERYADYRNYLKFSMYERVTDENGNEKKNPVDEMAGRDSGGEGQNPKYVALLAGFAMLYMQQSNRDSRIKLVLLDEAFSKMDKERSEVCLRYARELDLQLIVCVPDERLQSLIQYVDSVYGFRRHQNRVSMMHIDKGNYLKMLEGEDTDMEEKIQSEEEKR
ncbi:MAG: hypothetical protein EOM40_10475 [Clostridia bacterium]|nr:hypothetical protein [Clostridia bacterium]